MKKVVALLLTCVMVFSLCACSNSSSEKPDNTNKTTTESSTEPSKAVKDLSEIKIGMISDNTVAEARVRTYEKAKEMSEKLGFELIFQDPNMDEAEQVRQVENMITMGVDALILMCVNSEAIVPAVKECNEAGIPVLCWGRMIDDGELAAFVGSSVDNIGTMQIEYILENFPVTEPQNWICLDGPYTNPYCSIWHDQWLEAMQPYIDEGLINVVGWTQIEDADTQNAMETTENFLTAAEDDVDVCMAISDTIATGAAQALAEHGLSHIPITGLDAETIVLKRIADGTQTMTIALDDYACGEVAINTALGILGIYELGEPDDYLENKNGEVPCYYAQPVFVTKENLADIVAMGYGTPEDVYADVPKENWPEQFT